jgi:hypothetical protein
MNKIIVREDSRISQEFGEIIECINDKDIYGNELVHLFSSSTLIPVPKCVVNDKEYDVLSTVFPTICDVIQEYLKTANKSTLKFPLDQDFIITDSTGKVIYDLYQQDMTVLNFYTTISLRLQKP